MNLFLSGSRLLRLSQQQGTAQFSLLFIVWLLASTTEKSWSPLSLKKEKREERKKEKKKGGGGGGGGGRRTKR